MSGMSLAAVDAEGSDRENDGRLTAPWSFFSHDEGIGGAWARRAHQIRNQLSSSDAEPIELLCPLPRRQQR